MDWIRTFFVSKPFLSGPGSSKVDLPMYLEIWMILLLTSHFTLFLGSPNISGCVGFLSPQLELRIVGLKIWVMFKRRMNPKNLGIYMTNKKIRPVT